MNVYDWVKDLASPSPAPGGGGASALAGALAAALGSMVANLTTGKKKYAAYQQDIERILEETARLTDRLYGLIQKDEEAFLPLSRAYGIPKEDPARGEVLEAALHRRRAAYGDACRSCRAASHFRRAFGKGKPPCRQRRGLCRHLLRFRGTGGFAESVGEYPSHGG